MLTEERRKRIADMLLTNDAAYSKIAHTTNPYGDGKASERIVNSILYHFGKTNHRPKDFLAKP